MNIPYTIINDKIGMNGIVTIVHPDGSRRQEYNAERYQAAYQQLYNSMLLEAWERYNGRVTGVDIICTKG